MFAHHEDDLRSRHRCTDCGCCIVFVGALVVFAGVYAKLLVEGNVGRLYHGINYAGQVCGVDAGVQNQPYLYWCMSSTSGVPRVALDKPICVAACPVVQQGADAFTRAGTEPDCAVVAGAEAMVAYGTVQVLGRFCLPDPTAYPDLANSISSGQLHDLETFTVESLSSISASWAVLLGSFFLGILLGYVYLLLLRHCAELLIWITMVLCVVGFGVLGVFLFANAGTLSSQFQAQVQAAQAPAGFTDNEEAVTRAAAGVCFLLSFLAACMGCCFRHSIAVGAACIEVACETIFEMPSLLLLPVCKAVFKGILSLVLLVGFLLLYSSSDIISGTEGESPHYTHSSEQVCMLLLYMLMAFWILVFVSALYQFIVAYAVAEYYYTPYDHDNEKDVGCCAVWDGLYFGLILHGGSLAFGSFLVAVFMVLQKVLEYAKAKNKEAGGNGVVDCVLCCCLCLVNCCKECVELINRNAFIDMAITSSDFCTAARNALEMIAELGGAMAILNGATLVFTVFGCIAIALGCAAFTNVLVRQGVFADQSSSFVVANPIAPTIVSGLIGGLVGTNFMNVFDVTSDTLLYCYGVDLHSGKGGYTAPAALKELVHGSSDH